MSSSSTVPPAVTDKKTKLEPIWKEFLSTTTAHGFSKLETPSKRRRVFWILILILANIGFGVHLTFLVIRFTGKPVTSQRQEQPFGFRFPDVTFCPGNRFSSVKFNYTNLSEFGGMKAVDVADKLQDIWVQITNNATNVVDYPMLSLRDSLIRHNIIYEPPELVFMCEMYGYACDFTNFTALIDPARLGCATYHGPTVLSTESVDAIIEGLGILMLSRKSDSKYNSAFTHRKMDLFDGAVVQVHEPGTLPTFIENTFQSTNGQAFVMRISSATFQAEQTPGNPCLNTRGKFTVVVPGTNVTKSYFQTDESCLTECLQDQIQLECGCFSENLYLTVKQAAKGLLGCHAGALKYVMTNSSSVPTAELLQLREQWECHNRLMQSSISSEVKCSCPNFCKKSFYTSSTSNILFPDYKALNKIQLVEIEDIHNPAYIALRNKLNYTSLVTTSDIDFYPTGGFFLTSDYREAITSHLAKFFIIPEVTKVLTVTESFTYPIDNLFSDFGSIMGLWLGMSVLTLCEFIETGIKIFINLN